MDRNWTDSFCNSLVLQSSNTKKNDALEFDYNFWDKRNGNTFGHYELEIEKVIERLLNKTWPLMKSTDHPDHLVLNHVWGAQTSTSTKHLSHMPCRELYRPRPRSELWNQNMQLLLPENAICYMEVYWNRGTTVPPNHPLWLYFPF